MHYVNASETCILCSADLHVIVAPEENVCFTCNIYYKYCFRVTIYPIIDRFYFPSLVSLVLFTNRLEVGE